MSKWTVSAFSDEGGSTCDEQIQALKSAGLNFIDIRSIDGFGISDLPLDKAREIKEKLDAAGIAVQMFGSPIGKIDVTDDLEIDLDRLRRLGALAPILNCNAVRIFSYYNKTGLSHDEWSEASLSRLGRLRDEARILGMVLYHENEHHIFGDLTADVRVIGDTLRDDGSFKMIFDFDNYNQSGENVWETWQSLKDQVDAFHLKDSAAGQHVPVGLGTGSVKAILADALARGWSGPVSVEPHLNHSGAVAATNPSGIENQSFKDMSPAETFAIACDAATKLMAEVGAPTA